MKTMLFNLQQNVIENAVKKLSITKEHLNIHLKMMNKYLELTILIAIKNNVSECRL